MIQKLYHLFADGLCARIPQPAPSRDRVAEAEIISHRGEHDNRTILENTIPAFDAAVAAGADGIEFDIRWTRDLHPVVYHDPDLRRFFKTGRRICDIPFSEIRANYPAIPSLFEVIERFGGRVHLMAEIKKESYPQAERQSEILQSAFSALKPVQDYHFLSLDPEMFRFVPFAPASTCLPVAERNVIALSRLALRKGYGGILGHFYLIGTQRIAMHRKKGQLVGTGYISSRNCLCREINRGVAWIFTEQAEKICRIRKELERF